MRGHAEGDVDLFRDDDHADGGQHAVHRSHREKLAQRAEAEGTEENLNTTGHHADREGFLITKLAHRAEHDGDHAGGGTFDRELGVAHEGREDAADDCGEDPGDRGTSAGLRDAEAERQRDEEDEKAGHHVLAKMLLEAGEVADGLWTGGRSGGGGSGHGAW